MPLNGFGFTKAKTSLSFLEGKLRRALGLVGDVGATFQPNLTPVIIAGDLREPGNSDGFTGRQWFLGKSQNAAGNTWACRFDNDVIIEGAAFGGLSAATQPLVAWLGIPGSTPDIAVSVNAGVWVDRRTTLSDLVPITIAPNWGVGGAGPAESDSNRIWNHFSTGAPGPSLHSRLMLPAGSIINFRASAGGQINIMMWGRIWP